MPDGPAPSPPEPREPSSSERLDSWKEIAAYLRRDVRTVQRWEKKAGMPVHRHLYDKLGAVYAYRPELDTWWRDRRPPDEDEPEQEVKLEPEEKPEPEAEPEQSIEPQRNKPEEEIVSPAPAKQAISPWLLLVLGGVVFLAIYLLRPKIWPEVKPPSGKVMLAVLPFDNLSGDPQQDYFSDGLTEEMIAQLGRMHPDRLGVIARTTIMQYKGTHKSAEEIGAELRVDYILEGSVRRDGNKARITAQLIQVSDQTHRWAEDYDRDLRDILALQSDVAKAIARQIQLQLTPQQQQRLTQTRAVNPEAYEAYLRGRFFWNKRTDDALQRSIDYFNEAIQKDPSYALAHAGLADTYGVLAFFSVRPPNEAYPRAKAAALRALQLDDSLGEAHALLADVMYHYDWDWPAAEARFKRAIELNPNYATAHQWYAVFLDLSGRIEEAGVEIEHARALDPLSLAINTDAAGHYYYARQYDQAVAQCRKALDMDPNFPLAHIWLGMAYVQKKMYPEAIEEFRKVQSVSPTALALLGHTYGLSGRQSEALGVLQDLRNLSRRRYVSPAFFASVYIGLGDANQAFRWLDQAAQVHSPMLVRLKMEPVVDSLRSDPRFAAMLQKVRFPAPNASSTPAAKPAQ